MTGRTPLPVVAAIAVLAMHPFCIQASHAASACSLCTPPALKRIRHAPGIHFIKKLQRCRRTCTKQFLQASSRG